MIKVGGFKYGTFGLREEWVEDLIKRGEEFFVNNSLGPKQLDALIYYLRDMELIDKNNRLTILFDFISKIYKINGMKDMFLWSIIWVNLCMNAILFRWWIDIPTGIYPRKVLLDMMVTSYGKQNKSVINGYLSLVGTFERTEIGRGLKQGIVIEEGNTRTVIKEENPDISPFSILYLLYRLGERYGKYSFSLSTFNEQLISPCKVFNIKDSILFSKLNALWLPEILDLCEEGERISINLNSDKNHLDIINLYIRRLA